MTAAVTVPDDTVGAFVGRPAILATGTPRGPLEGVSLAVKDLVDVAGVVTGAGNPTYAAGRAPAARHAPAVDSLLAAGATVVGKTITDELAYSLSGTNTHFGTPVNVAAPGRAPGGSSAGSAAAVAAGLVDLAIGTDTGGSIRVPASHCGILGWRPTHGAIPLDGVVPLAPSFDTVGLLARDAELLRAGAGALISGGGPATSLTSLVVVEEALAVVAEPVAGAVLAAAVRLAAAVGIPLDTRPIGIDMDAALVAFRARQGWEAWAAHGAWIEATAPAMGDGIRGRFEAASTITAGDVAASDSVRAAVRRRIVDVTTGGAALVVPAASGPAPAPGMAPGDYAAMRLATIRLTALAGLAGAPAVALPLAEADGLPLGVCLVGAPGGDLALLDATVTAMTAR